LKLKVKEIKERIEEIRSDPSFDEKNIERAIRKKALLNDFKKALDKRKQGCVDIFDMISDHLDISFGTLLVSMCRLNCSEEFGN